MARDLCSIDYVKQKINDQKQHIKDHLFMTTTKRGRGNEVTKFWAILQIVVDGFGEEGYISDLVDIYMYRKQISIIKIQAHFVINLKVYNGDT